MSHLHEQSNSESESRTIVVSYCRRTVQGILFNEYSFGLVRRKNSGDCGDISRTRGMYLTPQNWMLKKG